MATEKTDVVIVGVGAAGGILAAELGKAGMKVIGLERGPRLKTADFKPHDELRYFQRQDLRPNLKRQPVTWRPNANARANPMPGSTTATRPAAAPCTTARCRGACTRTISARARRRSSAMARPRSRRTPRSVDWPLSYADLEPFYDRAEYELGVSGKAGNLQGQQDRRRQRVRGAAPARISAAAAAGGSSRRAVRSRRARSSAITRSRRRARSSRSPTRAGRAAPIAASARRSAATSARSRRSW